MSILDRLVFGAVMHGVGLVGAVLTTALLVIRFVDEVGAAVNDYTVMGVLVHELLILPEQLIDALPLLLLTGTVLGLTALSNRSEIIAMRASGMSLARLYGSVAAPICAVMLVALAAGEFVVPRLNETAETHKQVGISGSRTVWLPGGRWHREAQMMIHARAIGADGELHGVSVFHLDQAGKHIRAIWHARWARPITSDLWALTGVVGTQFDDALPHAFQAGSDEPRIIEMSPTVTSTRLLLEPDRLSLRELADAIAFRVREGLDTIDYEIAWWNQVLRLPAALASALLALGFVIGSTRNVSASVRLGVAIAVGLLFRFLTDLAGPLSVVYGLPPALGIAFPTILVLAASRYLLRQR